MYISVVGRAQKTIKFIKVQLGSVLSTWYDFSHLSLQPCEECILSFIVFLRTWRLKKWGIWTLQRVSYGGREGMAGGEGMKWDSRCLLKIFEWHLCQGFSIFSIDISDQIIIVGGYRGHYLMFRNIPDLHSLSVSNTIVVPTKNVPRCCLLGQRTKSLLCCVLKVIEKLW